MTSNLQRNTVTYIVRIWAEYLQASPLQWRGVIDPMDGGKKLHFASLDQMTALIQENTRLNNPGENQP